jgi:DNA polymerase-3 subunit gamma/tau
VALALYRKYRPRTFAEVIGQEHVTEPLAQALRSGRLHHAYLFSGPRGCGKTSSARILARSLNCERGPTPEPCGECESCRSLAPDGAGSIDVIEIDAASHGGVDDARELRERAFFAPVASRFKVYVIDEAHMVSSAGFNALLKLVEEPPDYVKFVFATTEPEKVLGTIKSRTHHYPFRLIPPGVLRPYLEQLTNAEGVKVEPAVFPLVVRAGGGSARDTLSVLDQLIAGAGADGVSYARAVALLGVTDVALIDEMCDSLAAGDGAGAYGVIDRVVEAGHDPRRFASDLLERLRDLIILQQVPDAVAKGLLDAPEDQLERMAGQAAHLGAASLSRFADIVHNGLTEMRGTTAPRLLLELICARMLLPGTDDSAGALLQRLERLERRLAAGGDVSGVLSEAGTATEHPRVVQQRPAEAPTPAVHEPAAYASTTHEPTGYEPAAQQPPTQQAPAQQPSAHQPVADPAGEHGPSPAHTVDEHGAQPGGVHGPSGAQSAGPAAPGALDAVAVRRVWDEVLSIVSRKSKKAAAVVREATVRDVEGETLVLVFKHSVHANMLTNAPDVLVEALYELLGGQWKIRCEVDGQAGGSNPRLQGQTSRPATGPPPGGASTAPSSPPGPRPPAPSSGPTSTAAGSSHRSTSSATDTGVRSASGAVQAGVRSATAASLHSASAEAEDWPTPARLGGAAAAPQPASSGQHQHQSPPQPVTDDWPTPALPGGALQAAQAGAAQAAARTAAAAAGSPNATSTANAAGATMAGGPDAANPGAHSAAGTATNAGTGMAAHPEAGMAASPGAGMAASPGAGMAASPGAGMAASPGAGMAASPGAGMAANAGVADTASGMPSTAAGAASAMAGALPTTTTMAGSTPARPAATATMAGTGPSPAGPASSVASSNTVTQRGRSGGAVPSTSRRSSAVEQARAAASRAGAGVAQRGPGGGAAQRGAGAGAAQRGAGAAQRGGGAGAAQRGGGGRRSADSAWDGASDEPPYDPDYDAPVADPQYPGFDPGDEPLDDADPSAVRESSEEAALRLLSEALGAERITETGP